MLNAADVPFEPMGAGVDEDSAKEALCADGISPRNLADALAELKATKLSQRFPEALVLGCDQVASLDGAIYDKATSREEARDHLRALRGETHQQISAAVICEAGKPVWRHIDIAKLSMREFSDAFLDSYLDQEWPAIGGCAGGYRLEGRGAQLFSRIDGNYFTILGLPLLPLLEYLRVRGVMTE
ncbi:Maf-like protein [Parasphingopyxis sp. CP4]|uniref:Maf family protein n=1 Tax=Parasphingopyxis sp. CP4 TaxID=2724527 RepID=UPI0015A0CDC6|nr:nucleoside triphosphate pyrophosphatase [Parasphingopyxis sp. CP4]QLC20705.1 Maf-like protein [Parasphingopyxis sp. CP4]